MFSFYLSGYGEKSQLTVVFISDFQTEKPVAAHTEDFAELCLNALSAPYMHGKIPLLYTVKHSNSYELKSSVL